MANPNIPGVIVKNNDVSAAVRANISTNFCMIGAFERGDDTQPFLVSGGEAQFLKLCGTAEGAVIPSVYVGAVQMLKYAQGIWMINVTKSALYGGISVKRGDTTDLSAGFSAGKSTFAYTFGILSTQTLPYSLSGATTSWTGTLTKTRVQPGSVALRFTDNSSAVHNVVDNGLGAFVGTKISAGTINYETGAIALTFSESCTLVTIQTYNVDEAFALFAHSKKAWSDKYGVKITDHTKIKNELLSVGDGVSGTGTLSFSGNLKTDPQKKKTVVVTFTILGVTYSVVDAGDGTFTATTQLASGTITYSTGAIALVFTAAHAPDLGTTISASYSVADGFMDISEYNKDADGNDNFITTWVVSQDPAALDKNGISAYIEDVMNGVSTNFKAINNTAWLGDHINEITTVLYCDGGDNGVAPTNTEKALAIQLIAAAPQVDFSVFCGAGVANVDGSLLISDVQSLLNTKEAAGVIDFATTADITMMQNDINDMNVVPYAQNVSIPYNGRSYLVGMSAIDCANFALNIKNTGQFYMPPNGVTRGTINVTKMDRYFSDAEVEILQGKHINVVRYFKSYGNVIFSNMTSQKKLSATSYRNSVLTLHDMRKTLNDSLLIVDFDLINADTFRSLRTMVTTYLDQLAKFDGTIEKDYTLNIESLNNAETKDQKKIYAELIFVFQSLAEQVIFTLTYTSNKLYIEMK